MVKLLPYLKQNRKGQGIVEYALLLAFIVGIAVMLQGVGLKDAVVGVFDNVVTVLGGGKENKYVTAFKKWGTMDYDELVNESKSARIAADMDGLTNIAAYFNSLDMNISDIQDYLGENWRTNIDMKDNPDKGVQGAQVLQYWGTEGNENALSKIRNASAVDWMQQNNGTGYDKSYTGNWSGVSKSERYFFSDEMNSDEGSSEKKVKVAFTTDSSGNVTGTRVWVTQYRNYGVENGGSKQTQLTATDENGQETIYNVYIPKSK